MKISIITPCLNSAKTIRQTIESVLNQTYQDIEYIIVDGASTDGTLEIIQEYEDQFQGRMQYVSEPDNGIYDAMNKGIRMSHGNVIGIINSDDFYEEDAVYVGDLYRQTCNEFVFECPPLFVWYHQRNAHNSATLFFLLFIV